MKNISKIDLNLLVVFATICQEMSTTKAAKKLGLSQPAVSHALQRLRDLLSDPLFVRASRGLVPTKRALELERPIAELLEKLDVLLVKTEKFDPSTAKITFRIATTDYFEQVALPKLLHALQTQAPGIVLVSRSTLGTLPKEDLEAGTIDLAVAGFYGGLPEGYYQQQVFQDDFVCVMKADHPSAPRGKLSLKHYSKLRHIMISPQGDLKSKAAVLLKKHGFTQDIVAGVASFLSPGWTVCTTDLALTCPRKLAMAYQQYLPVEVFELPFELSKISVVQVWHGRNHSDPAHTWLRHLIREICASL